MTTLVPFVSDEFELSITAHETDGFHVVASGLAKSLGMRDAFRLMDTIPDTEKGYTTACTPGGEQRVGYLTEAGFYRALGQRQSSRITDTDVRSQVERFQAWVYGTVLPALRKGQMPAPLTREQRIALALQESQEIVAEQQAHIAELEPKARTFDTFLNSTGDYSVNEAAKSLSRDHSILTGEKRLFIFMEQIRWVYRDGKGKPVPYQAQVDCGRLVAKPRFHYHPETGEVVVDSPQVRVTAKGLEALHAKYLDESA